MVIDPETEARCSRKAATELAPVDAMTDLLDANHGNRTSVAQSSRYRRVRDAVLGRVELSVLGWAVAGSAGSF